jgi:hypothetical protein
MAWEATMEAELKPCPYCGNHGDRDPRHTYYRFGRHDQCVAEQCGQCGAMGPWNREGSEPVALADWNRRTAGAEEMHHG